MSINLNTITYTSTPINAINISDGNPQYISLHEEFSLKWNNYGSNLTASFQDLYRSESFVDVTLSCEGRSIKVHKCYISACSPYFRELLNAHPVKHPIIILYNVRYDDLKMIIDYMYRGEVTVKHDQINSFFQLAAALRVRGLTEEKIESDRQADGGDKSVMLIGNVDGKGMIEISSSGKSDKKRTKKSKTNGGGLRKKIKSNVDFFIGNGTEMVREIGLVSDQSMEGSSSDSQRTNDHSVGSTLDRTPVKDESTPSIGNVDEKWEISPCKTFKTKLPNWTQHQLIEAIESVITQKLRFTQASTVYNIPKGTLYDNILGKYHRMSVLNETGISGEDEAAIIEYCCDISMSPYNRRTKRSLREIIEFIRTLPSYNREKFIDSDSKFAFRWWWAFCKKHSIVSLYFDNKLFKKE